MTYFINILKKLTFKKGFNYISLFVTYQLNFIFKCSGNNILPFAVSIEPTTSCNLRCPQCPSGLRKFTRDTGMLNADLFKKVIEEIKSYVFMVTFYFQGEPFLNPDFLNMVNTANQNGLYTVTSTNGHYVTIDVARDIIESGLDEIIFSMDGTTQEIYTKYRVGGDLEKVKTGIKNLIKAKKESGFSHPHIVVQFVVFKFNEHQVEEIKAEAHSLGVDEVRIKTAQIYDFENSTDIIPSENFARYRKDKNGNWKIKNKLLNKCWRMWHSCVITWDGLVVPCCFDKDAKYHMGDLKEEKLKTIWNNNAYKTFRSKLSKGRKEIDICTNCTEGTKVWND